MLSLLLAASLPNPLFGRSVQVDPGFGYYQDRSPDSIARELEVNGYRVVRYVVTNDGNVDDKLIGAFHHRGISVWYQTFGNGFYGAATGLPAGWEAWKMKLLNETPVAGYTWLSLSHPDYRLWKRQRISEVMKRHAFDGVEIVEPFQMGWEGPEKGEYGDFSPAALSAFKKATGYDDPPEFRDKASIRWYKTDTERYRKWVDFRVNEVTGFLSDIAKAVRKSAPGKPFSVWALANSAPDKETNPADLAREWQGVDAVEMARVVKPDEICFQTNWPDWIRPELPATYPQWYRPLADPLRKAYPKLPFIVQADTGSTKGNRRSRAWIAGFEKACQSIGAVGSTAYSYEIALWMYTEKPQVRATERTTDGLLLIFQKRLDPVSASDTRNYTIRGVKVVSAHFDGNLVRLKLDGAKKGKRYPLQISGVKDDPSRWLEKGQPANLTSQKLSFTG